MGDHLNSKLNTSLLPCIRLYCILYRTGLLLVPKGATCTADGEGQGFDGAGEKMERG